MSVPTTLSELERRDGTRVAKFYGRISVITLDQVWHDNTCGDLETYFMGQIYLHHKGAFPLAFSKLSGPRIDARQWYEKQ